MPPDTITIIVLQYCLDSFRTSRRYSNDIYFPRDFLRLSCFSSLYKIGVFPTFAAQSPNQGREVGMSVATNIMSSYIHPIEDLEEQTGLKRKYIDKCYKAMPDVFYGSRRKSPEGNKWLYNSNALVILQRVRHLKDEGFDIPNIKQTIGLTREATTESGKNGGEVVVENREEEEAPVDPTNLFLKAIRESHKETLELSKELIAAKEETIVSLRRELSLALPDGRKPEEVREELKEGKQLKEENLRLNQERQKNHPPTTENADVACSTIENGWSILKGKEKKNPRPDQEIRGRCIHAITEVQYECELAPTCLWITLE